MPKKRSGGQTGLYVFLGLGGLVAAGLAVWILGDLGRAKQEAAEAAKVVPALPAGRLQFLQSGMGEARYLALDETHRSGQTVATVILKVGRTPSALEGGVALESRRETVDCAGQRVFEGKIGAFDLDGKLTSATNGFAGKRGRPVEAGDWEVPALCAGKTGRVLADWRVAQRESQALPDGHVALAERRPRDARAWAWLCASAARGAWRAAAFKDCAHALQLAPDDAHLRVDRAYIDLKTGHWAEAEADFRKVLAADPKHAGAQYGLSLLRVLTHDEAGGKRERGKALDLDADIPNWAAQTYQMPISREYRVR